ncbi:ankyrin repeat-containing domain protein [Trichoderma ceciliae]
MTLNTYSREFTTLKHIYGSILRRVVSRRRLHDTGSIQVTGPTGYGKSALLKLIVQEIRQTSSVIVPECYLTPSAGDPTIYSLLASFLHQIISQRPTWFYAIRNVVAELLLRDTWTEQNLRRIIEVMLHRCEGLEFLILIYDYDNKRWPKEIRSWWSGELLPFLQSKGTKFTVVTSSRNRIDNLAIKKLYVINLEGKHEQHRKDLVQAKLNSLLDQGYGSTRFGYGPAADIKGMIAPKAEVFTGSFKAIGANLTLLCQRFSLTTAAAIKGRIEAGPTTEQELYEREISALQSNHKDISFWIGSAVSWMMWSARPLRLEELAAATAVNLKDKEMRNIEEKVSMDMIQDLKRHLGLIVAVENGQGRIATEAVRAILATTPKKQLCLQHDDELTKLCLHYLRLVLTETTHKKDHLTDGDERWKKCLSHVSWKHQKCIYGEPALEFLDYACRFWPTHFLRIKNPNNSLKDEVAEFLQSSDGQKLFQIYLLCHGQLTNPFDMMKSPKERQSSTEKVIRELEGSEIAEDYYPLHTAALGGSLKTSIAMLRLLKNPAQKNKDGRTALHMAAVGGSTGIILLLLGKDAFEHEPMGTVAFNTLNEQDNRLQTPLIIAAIMGQVEAIKILLQCGADASIQDNTGKTVLHYAVLISPAAVQDLMSPELAYIRDSDGRTALHIASTSGNIYTTSIIAAALQKRLLFKDVINLEDNSHKTPLQYAAKNGYTAIIEDFLRFPDCVEDGNYKLAAELAAAYGHLETVRLFISGCGQDIRGQLFIAATGNGQLLIVQYLLLKEDISPDVDWEYHRPLCQASARGYIEVVRALLSGASVSTSDGQRKTPLHYAAEKGMSTVANELLEKNVNVNAPDIDRKTPLHSAAREGKTSAVTLLLKYKANVNASSQTRETPLHLAVRYPKVVLALLDAGAEPHASDNLGQTPLHMAAIHQCPESVRHLLNKKANRYKLDDNGRLPIYYAITTNSVPTVQEFRKGSQDVATLLIQTSWAIESGAFTVVKHFIEQHNGTVDFKANLLHDAALGKSVEILDFLLRSGVDASFQRQGSSALHLAAKNGRVESIAKLLEFKADIEALDDNANTPLHVAVRANQAEATKALLNAGSNINAQNGDQWTPVYTAAYHGIIKSLQILLDYQPDMTIPDGWTPLHLATYWRNLPAVDLLLQRRGDPTLTTKYGNTALHLAIGEHNVEMVNAMLMHGAKECINKRGKVNEIPLHLALKCSLCSPEITQPLISYGADIDLRTNTDQSTLKLAVDTQDLQKLNLLLDAKLKSRGDRKWHLNDLILVYWRVITSHCQGIAKDQNISNSKYLEIVKALVKKEPKLLENESAVEGLNALEMCLSKRGNQCEEEPFALLFVHLGINPLLRRQPNHKSALELGMLSRRSAKANFLNLCINKIPTDVADAAAWRLGFRELRIATELDQLDMWHKLKPLKSQVCNVVDEDGWSLDNFINQAAGRIPIPMEESPSASFKTPQKIKFPPSWASDDQKSGERFKIEVDKLTVEFSQSSESLDDNASVRADFPFPPRPISLLDDGIRYFEVGILTAGTKSDDNGENSETRPLPIVAIGFCNEFADMRKAFLGWHIGTVGYHSDDGKIFENYSTRHSTELMFKPGDTVGCGIDYSKEEYFFTWDGKVVAHHKSKVIFRKLYPAISHRDGPCKVRVNFGESEFVWQRENGNSARSSERLYRG